MMQWTNSVTRIGAVALVAIGLPAQAITPSGSVVVPLVSSTFNSCTQITTQQSIPIGPLPAPASLPGFVWNLSASGITLNASGTANICSFSSPAGSFSRNGTVAVTLVAPFETTCSIVVSGTYSALGASATTSVSGAVQGTLGGFFSPVTTINQTSTVIVGPAGKTITIAHSCSASAANFSGFAQVNTSLNVTWAPLNAASTANFGVGCLVASPIQAATSLPQLGGNMTGTVTAVAGPNPLGVIAIGFSDSASTVGALPFALTQVGMTDCSLLQSAELTLPASPSSATSLAFQIGLPTNPIFVGVNLFTQAFCVALGANPLGVTASNGVRWRLGT